VSCRTPANTWGLKRYEQAHWLHFVTFSATIALLPASPDARRIVEQTLEQVRLWYVFYLTGYVVMPEHLHLLLSEPEHAKLSTALQMLKQITAHKLISYAPPMFSGKPATTTSTYGESTNGIEKLRYIHRNPVQRGLCESPEDWEWSSFRHHLRGVEGVVEIESQWTARRREQLGVTVRLMHRA
jgi:putative transposase